MKGDFSRFSFDPAKNYTGVLMQQGRVQLDSDWNEQVAIARNQRETLLRDVIGEHGGPQANGGFEIAFHSAHSGDFSIGAGRYYVNGILCENHHTVSYLKQPHYPDAVVLTHNTSSPYIAVYLEVWERSVNGFEDENLREIALGDQDTTTRIQTIWQVKLLPVSHVIDQFVDDPPQVEGHILNSPQWTHLVEGSRGRMSVRRTSAQSTLDNQLYRVEIHDGGDTPTFKWSRNNGALVYAVESLTQTAGQSQETIVTVKGGFLQDLQNGSWVEIVDDVATLTERPNPLMRIERITGSQIRLSGVYPGDFSPQELAERHTYLRLWDQQPASADGGAILIEPGKYIALENGIEIYFEDGSYHSGDSWVFTARSRMTDIAWPSENGTPVAQPPTGPRHHFCLLSLLRHAHSEWHVLHDFRRLFPSMTGLLEINQELQRLNAQLREENARLPRITVERFGEGTSTKSEDRLYLILTIPSEDGTTRETIRLLVNNGEHADLESGESPSVTIHVPKRRANEEHP